MAKPHLDLLSPSVRRLGDAFGLIIVIRIVIICPILIETKIKEKKKAKM